MGKYLIIGGNSGIGKAILENLNREGHEVIAANRKGLTEMPLGVEYLEYDATDAESTLTLSEAIDGVVYCPGSINLRPFARLSMEEVLQEMELNFFGAFRTLQQVLPVLKKSDKASIVLFSTVAVGTGMPFHASIAAAKGAIEGLTRSLAAEFAPSIRVNAIAPSLTDTPLAEKLLGNEVRKQAAADRHPLKKFGTAEDIAEAACYLLTPKSQWITGQILHLDGGMSSVRI
jgi:NAD(P)-dependent dehydrogenase (short-subunit alcohol dehydrogenase family)